MLLPDEIGNEYLTASRKFWPPCGIKLPPIKAISAIENNFSRWPISSIKLIFLEKSKWKLFLENKDTSRLNFLMVFKILFVLSGCLGAITKIIFCSIKYLNASIKIPSSGSWVLAQIIIL